MVVWWPTGEATLGEFEKLVCDVMHGSHFKDEAARALCELVTPSQLAQIVVSPDATQLQNIVGAAWAPEMKRRFSVLTELHKLEIVEKPPKPVIKVLTKTAPSKTIPVNQLSDGQKHTILLTIALLAESNTPLIMDQRRTILTMLSSSLASCELFVRSKSGVRSFW